MSLSYLGSRYAWSVINWVASEEIDPKTDHRINEAIREEFKKQMRILKKYDVWIMRESILGQGGNIPKTSVIASKYGVSVSKVEETRRVCKPILVKLVRMLGGET